ncbi:MAG: hypothetical protein QOD03_808 [Verrucomicrobiota bacterium]|jgi:hypothetical protein
MKEKRGSGDPPHRRRHRLRTFLFILLVLIVILGIARAMLPWFVRNYVNRTLDRNPLYSGKIGQVQIHLWRGAYSIQDIRLSKTTGNVPVPLFAAKRVDFALEWNALLHHRIVARVLMEQPEINFVDAPTEDESQSGIGGPWLQMIRDLSPFKINSAIIREGSVHFRAYQTAKPLDVYLTQVEGSIDNLSNIGNETVPLAASIQAKAVAMDQAKLEFKMTLDPFSYRPTFHLALRLLGLDVTKINDLALAYGKFDFKRGWFDLVIDADSKEGQLTGYVKPLFRNLQVFSVTKDIQEDNVLQFFWQALVGAATNLLKNRPRDQFGTLIPFTADASNTTSADILATIGNILRNAFVRAYLPHLENGQDKVDGLQFGAPDFTESLSTSDSAQ